MSKITRRDFLKTAGVMTLAVAAAGVLSGCEGNTAPEAPVTGTKKLGDVIKVGNVEFSVDQAVLAQTKGKFDPNTGVQKEPTDRKLGLIFTVKNVNKDAKEVKFSFNNVTVRINGEAFAMSQNTLTADVYGLETDPEKVTTLTNALTNALPYNEKATAFQYVVDCKTVKEFADSDEAYEAINKIEVIVDDKANLVYTTYEIAVPAVQEFGQKSDYAV